MRTSGYFKTLDFMINLYQEPGAAESFIAFLLNRDTSTLLTATEMDIASYSQFMEAMQIFAYGFPLAINWRDFYNLDPSKMLFHVVFSLFSQTTFSDPFKFSNKVFMQSLVASMLSYVLMGELSGLISKNPTQYIEKIGLSNTPAGTLSDWLLYLAMVLVAPALVLTYLNLRLFVAIDTIGATTPLQRAVIKDDQIKFESLLFRGANMYKMYNNNRGLDELQPETPRINLPKYNYVRNN